jgi:hypothetical protein
VIELMCIGGAMLAALGPIAVGFCRQLAGVARPMAVELLWLTAFGFALAVTGFILNKHLRLRAKRRAWKAAKLV